MASLVEVELSRIRLPLLFSHIAETESSASVSGDLTEMRNALRWGLEIAPALWPEIPIAAAAIVSVFGGAGFLWWRRARQRELDHARNELKAKEQELLEGREQAKQALSTKQQELDELSEGRKKLEQTLKEYRDREGSAPGENWERSIESG